MQFLDLRNKGPKTQNRIQQETHNIAQLWWKRSQAMEDNKTLLYPIAICQECSLQDIK